MILTHFLTMFAVSGGSTDMPITLAEAKEHLRIVDDADDDYITGLIEAALEKIELDTGVALQDRSITWAFDGWQSMGKPRLVLPRRPLNSVTSVVYDDANGVQQTLASDQYRIRDFTAGVAQIIPANGVTWPEAEAIDGAVRVTFSAGYVLADDVPATLRHAGLLLIGHWYENREAVNVGGMVTPVDLAYDALIAPFRRNLVA